MAVFYSFLVALAVLYSVSCDSDSAFQQDLQNLKNEEPLENKWVQHPKISKDDIQFCSKQTVGYPTYHAIPPTSFKCEDQDYIPGFYADVETGCQVYHVCTEDNRRESIICPESTVFDQTTLFCENWNKVNCPNSPSHYHVNSQFARGEPEQTTLDPEIQTYETQEEFLAAVRKTVLRTVIYMVRNSIVKPDL